jgi:hypothetical protein
MLLTSTRHEVDADITRFAEIAAERGWGDGLPLVPPTPARVEQYVLASGREPDTVIGQVPPLRGDCTVERLATNAVMAGAPADAMPLLVAAIEALLEPDFDLAALNSTTAAVAPALIVNGPVRHRLGVAFGASCIGGADGSNASIGRALRLVLRNVGGLRAGSTTQSVFGQPARTTGIVFGEWEERSPWAPLAERRGVIGDAVTVFGAMGTMNIIDLESDTADLLLQQIGRALANPGANGFFSRIAFAEIVVGINPIWAEIIGRRYSDIADVEYKIWDEAALPLELWPPIRQEAFIEAGRVSADGRVHLMREENIRLLVVVCGGLGGHHALGLHDFGSSSAITQAVTSPLNQPGTAPGAR